MWFSIVFFLMALLRLPIALLLHSLSFLWFSHDLPVTVTCSCPWCYFCCFTFSCFLHCLLLFSYGFPWIFLWLPFFVCVPIVPWLSHNFICFTCGFLCFSLFCCFPIVVLWLCAPKVFLGSPMALLGFAIWFPVVFLGPPLRKTKAKPGNIGNHRKSMEKQSFPGSSNHENPPPPRTSRPPPELLRPLDLLIKGFGILCTMEEISTNHILLRSFLA